MYCPHCHADLPDGTCFCPNCGTKIPSPQTKQFCTQCGAELPDGVLFCTNCGARRETSGEPGPQAETHQPPSQQEPRPAVPPRYQPAHKGLVCPQCGAPLTVKRKFCVKCGANVGALWGMEDAPAQKKQKESSIKIPKAAIAGFCAALAVVLLVTGLFLLGDSDSGGDVFTGNLQEDYDYLCALTASGTDHYVYARMLTEGLLETDTTVATPQTMNGLFERCITAWKNAAALAKQAFQVSDGLKGQLHATDSDTLTPFLIAASAAGAEDGLQTPEESLAACAVLNSQYFGDASAVLQQIQQLQQIYQGRTTSQEDWNAGVQAVVGVMETEILISGDIQGTRFTTGVPKSVHTLTRTVKSGTAVVNGVTTMVNVSEEGSAIVVGQNDDGVVMDTAEVGQYLNEGSTITISSETPQEMSPILFYKKSLSAWFFLDKVGGFQISRDAKGKVHVESGTEDITQPGGTLAENPVPPVVTTPERPTFIPTEPPAPPAPPASPVSQPPVNITQEPTRDGDPQDHPGQNARSGKITVRLSWDSHDDLDIHMNTPDGSHIYFRRKVAGGGILDVDMNANSGNLYTNPIENIYFDNPENGHYQVYLKNFRDRTAGESTHYKVSVTIDGVEKIYEGDIGDDNEQIPICEFDYGGSTNTPPAPPTGGDLVNVLDELNAGTGTIHVSMIWNTQDDLDLHIENPDGSEVSFRDPQAGGGVLDIDANSPGKMRMPNPVENIFYETPSSGHYKVFLENYNDRTTDSTTHYLVRVKVGDKTQEFEGTIDGSSTRIPIVEFDYGGGRSGNIPAEAKSFNGHYYHLYDNAMNWIDAKAFCVSLGGHLVTITTPEEQAFIESAYPGSSAWIGGFYAEPSWHWVTGEPMDYTSWCPGEPNFQNGNEWVMHLYSGMKWNDLPDEDTRFHRGFLCEWDHMADISEETMQGALDEHGASTGEITISLGWSTIDDMDLHVFTPNEVEIYYNNMTADGAVMDVDMIPDTSDDLPCVENIYFNQPKNGEYYVYVDKFTDRTGEPTYYLVKVQIGNEVKTFEGTISGQSSKQICAFQYNGEGSTPAAASVGICGTTYTWEGKWSTNWGEMELVQDGTTVTGHYAHDDGVIRATASDNVLKGVWEEPGQIGQIFWVMDDSGTKFTGNLSYEENEVPASGDTGWTGTRIFD